MTGGPRLGGKVADVVTRALADHQRRRAPDVVRLAMAIQHSFFELTGGEHRLTSGGLYRDLAATGELDGWAHDLMQFLGDGHGQWQTLLAGQATGAALGAGILSVLTNELAPAIQGLLETNPHMILAPPDLAIAVTRGVIDWVTGESDAHKGGLGSESFRRLVQSNYNLPVLTDTMLAYRRGQITAERADTILNRNGYDPEFFDVLKNGTMLDLTPEQLADMTIRGIVTQDDGAKMAAHSGMPAELFAHMVENAGEPPGLDQLLFAFRRGIIDQARLERGIRQSRTRNEWVDVVESLGAVPMSTADAVEAAVQGHLTYDQAKVIATQNGLRPTDFDALYQTAGSPPGAQEMMTLWRRGLVDEAGVRQALVETRLKPKYTALVLSTKEVLLPMVAIRRAFTAGAMTHTRALQLLAQHGYSAQDSEAILAETKTAKTAKLRDLTEAQVMTLYRDGAMSDAQATSMLEALGYSVDEIAWLFDLLKAQANQRLMDAAIASVRTRYVGHHISESQAQAALDTILVPPAQRDQLFTLWDIERQATMHTLTQAQCSAALKKGLIDQGEFSARLADMGYPDADIAILAALAG